MNLINKLKIHILVIATLAFLLYTAYQVQIAQGIEYYAQSAQVLISSSYLAEPRGLFLDREGRVLADNEEVFDVYLDPTNLSKDRLLDTLITHNSEPITKGEKLKIQSEELVQQVTNDERYGSEQLRIFTGLSREELGQIEQIEALKDYIKVVSGYRRVYPYPAEFAHILGYTGLVNQEEVTLGYEATDYIGKHKLEKSLEQELKGTKGQLVDSYGSQVKIPGQPGSNVYLTIDEKWQKKLYEIIAKYDTQNGAAGSAGVIIDVETGQIVSLVSYPGYDTNAFVTGVSTDYFNTLMTDRSRPLADKATSEAYTPGSIFKLISSYVLLETDVITPSSTYFSNQCLTIGGGYSLCEAGKNYYGTLDLYNALVKSSNLYFCNYMLALEEKLDVDQERVFGESLGLGHAQTSEIADEAIGKIDSPKTKDEWFSGDTCNMAIGQGATLVSPIQMANLVATYERDGEFKEPYIILKKSDSFGNVYYDGATSEHQTYKVTSQKNSFKEILEGMSRAAYSYQSALYYFFVNLPNNVKVKTGSAETVEVVNNEYVQRVHSWIVGSFQYNNKTYSFAIFQQFGGGGYYVAPAVREFLEFLNSSD